MKKKWLKFLILIAGVVGFWCLWPAPVNVEPESVGFSFGEPSLIGGGVKKMAVSSLNGDEVVIENSKKKVLGVMVENSLEARPQSGLSQADVVYEALVEGGITRFLAFFQSQKVEKIGPVRSVRPYFLSWAAEYDAVIIHDGGSEEALQLLNGSYAFLNDLAAGWYIDAFWRDQSRKVSWEHTLYTSTEGLDQVVKDNEWENWAEPDAWLFDLEGHGKDAVEPATDVTIPFSTPLFTVSYEYDEENENYLRKMAGVDHVDANGQQIAPENLVVVFTNVWLQEGDNPLGWVGVQTFGKGDAYVFQQGKLIKGTWKKDGLKSRMVFHDGDDEEVVFVPGQIWLHVVPSYMKARVTVDIK